MKRVARVIGAVIAIVLLGGAASPDPWAEDFAALKLGIARNDANFEHQLRERRVDLPKVAARYEAELAAAKEDGARRKIFESLIRNDLRDPHVWIEWDPPAEETPLAACPAAYAEQEKRSGLVWERLEGFQPLADAPATFRPGVYRAPGRPALGVVRIGLMSERAFDEPCHRAAREIGIAPDAPCDKACADRLEPLAGRYALEALARTVTQLEAAGAERLAIDLTDNSGGSDWVEAVVRLLAGPLPAAQVSMLKHPAWVTYLREREADLVKAQRSASTKNAAITGLLQRVRAAQPAVGETCDLSTAWTDSKLAMGETPLTCSPLVPGLFHSTGLLASGDARSDPALFVAARYGPIPPPTRLPIAVLVHDNTHSAAELMPAVLQDHRRATIVGSTTPGAGCGHFTSKGSAFTLPNSGAKVHVPDCVRLRADGSNERSGVVPDVLVPWGPADSGYMWTKKAADVLAGLP